MSVDPHPPLPPARATLGAAGALAFLLAFVPKLKAALTYAPYAAALGFVILALWQFHKHDYLMLFNEVFAALVALGIDAKVDALKHTSR